MKNNAIVVDLDNTIINTAQRKLKILNYMNISATIGTVEKDYNLIQVIPNEKKRDEFFKQLNSLEAIKNYKAEAHKFSECALEYIAKLNCRIIIVTTRSKDLEDITKLELQELNIQYDELHMLDKKAEQTEPKTDEIIKFKSDKLNHLKEKYIVVAHIGDRTHDAISAAKSDIVPIILLSTINNEDLNNIKEYYALACDNWNTITHEVEILINTSEQKLNNIRDSFIKQYSSWLKDLDEKCRISVMIASAILLISGKFLFTEDESLQILLLLAAFISSLIALIFGVRGYSSRYISGTNTASFFDTSPKQWVAVITSLKFLRDWLHHNNDAIDQYKKIKDPHDTSLNTNPLGKFFREKYNTSDPEKILNIRFFELRATNHAKAYSERFASRQILLSLALMIIWITLEIIPANHQKNTFNCMVNLSTPLITLSDAIQNNKNQNKIVTIYLQDLLKNTGDYSGQIDGKFGTQTFNAVKNFQNRNNLKETGYKDNITVKKLCATLL